MGAASKYFAQIPDYLDDLLSQEEKEAFEQQLETDDALARELALHREVTSSLGDHDQRRFREKLEMFNRKTPIEDPEGKKTSKFFSLKILISIAASLLLLIVLATWVLQSGHSAREQVTAYLDNYDPADILPPAYIAPDRDGKRGEDVTPPQLNQEDPLYEARQFFSQRQYPQALAALQIADPERLPDPNPYWYELGILYLLNDQPQPAVDALERINAPTLENAKRWHLALAYFQLNRQEDALAILQPLLEKSNPWQKAAKALNRAL